MKYCAFLRGVNVKGTSMKMSEVCKVFEQLALHDVTSVLASGNIIFSSDKNENELKKIIEKELSEYFDYEAFLFLKTKEEIEAIISKNPFTKQDDAHHYVFITADGFEKTLLESFESSEKTDQEKAEIVENTFYWQVPKGKTLDSHFGKILGKKDFKDKMTSRNINTFEKILKKM